MELEDLSLLINLKNNSIEEPQAIVGEEGIPLSKLKPEMKIISITYNSEVGDTKVAELNYYRGKDESLEGKKIKKKELEQQEQTQESINTLKKLESDIAKQERVIQDNKNTWDSKAKANQVQVALVKSKVQTAHSVNNQEIMDVLYPSKESIDTLNKEILDERRKSEEFLKTNKATKHKLSLRDRLQEIIKIPQVLAWGDSSNPVNNLVIYNRANWNYVWDVDYANASNGQTFKLWGRSNHAAQQFRFVDARGELRFVGQTGVEKCVDVDLANGSYDNGDRVHLWDCYGGSNQKFVTFSDGTIRPKSAQHMCLDASAGLNYGSRIHLWSCHGGDNQKFNGGEYDFDGQAFYIRIYASQTGVVSNWPESGHALVSVWRTNRGTTNTFSFWPSTDTNDLNDWGRINNIGTGNNINVDQGSNGKDWSIAVYGDDAGYKFRDIQIPKKVYDEIKYMRGYTLRQATTLFTNNGYNVCNNNCSSYSAYLWGYYTGNWINPIWPAWAGTCHAPGAIYNAI